MGSFKSISTYNPHFGESGDVKLGDFYDQDPINRANKTTLIKGAGGFVFGSGNILRTED
jgi:hypothetical protein